MVSFLATKTLRLFKWKITGIHPDDVPKKIIVVMPHTSNWDFILGLLVRASLQFKSNYLIKDVYFKGPWKWWFKRVGGVPVKRSKNSNLVDQVVEIFNSRDEFSIAITPEGTRKRVETLKTGFYHIARQADIPLMLTKLDYGKRIIDFGQPYIVGDNMEADINYIKEYFRDIKGKHPDQFGFNS